MTRLESDYSTQVSAQTTNLAPAQVTGVAFTLEQGKVLLSWTAVTENSDLSPVTDLGGYRIYRKHGVEEFTLLHTTDALAVTWTDESVKDGAAYVYAISAIDGTEIPLEGARSNELSVKTKPSIPLNVQATPHEESIELAWDSVLSLEDPTQNENLAGYAIYRSQQDGTSYALVGEVGRDTVKYLDEAVTQDTTYYYVVTAFDNTI